jgi:hypothetical protein
LLSRWVMAIGLQVSNGLTGWRCGMVKVVGAKKHTIRLVARLEFRKHCQVIKWLVLAQIGKPIRRLKSNGVLVISPIVMVVPLMLMHNGYPDPPIGTNMIPLMVLQVLPTPTGGTPINVQLTSTNFQADLARFIAQANKQGDHQLAMQFRAYALQQHALHPTLTVQQLLSAFVATELGGALSTGIGQTGTLLGQVPGAAAKGAEDAFKGLNLGNWFMRIGEILLGIVLVGVGVARITGAQNAISSFVKTKVPL